MSSESQLLGAVGDVEEKPEDPSAPDVGGCSSTLRDDGIFVLTVEPGTSSEAITQWFELVPLPPGYVLDSRAELRFTGLPVPGFDGPPGLGRGLCGTEVRS